SAGAALVRERAGGRARRAAAGGGGSMSGESATAARGRKVAVITGASSGFGAATAKALAADGYELVLGARRLDRLEEVATPLGARAIPLDVTDRASVEAFAAQVPRADVLVANAGKALGTDRIADARDALWREMYDTNVLGVLYSVQAFLPKLEASGDGVVVVVGSIAGF